MQPAQTCNIPIKTTHYLPHFPRHLCSVTNGTSFNQKVINQPISQSINQAINQTNEQSNMKQTKSINQSINQFNRPTNQSINQSTDQWINRSDKNNRSINQSMDRMNAWSSAKNNLPIFNDLKFLLDFRTLPWASVKQCKTFLPAYSSRKMGDVVGGNFVVVNTCCGSTSSRWATSRR